MVLHIVSVLELGQSASKMSIEVFLLPSLSLRVQIIMLSTTKFASSRLFLDDWISRNIGRCNARCQECFSSSCGVGYHSSNHLIPNPSSTYVLMYVATVRCCFCTPSTRHSVSHKPSSSNRLTAIIRAQSLGQLWTQGEMVQWKSGARWRIRKDLRVWALGSPL